jgi:hypothetical protein
MDVNLQRRILSNTPEIEGTIIQPDFFADLVAISHSPIATILVFASL